MLITQGSDFTAFRNTLIMTEKIARGINNCNSVNKKNKNINK